MAIASSNRNLDRRVCEQVRRTRDARFDGLFFIAVRSTGIYCRPICPAPTAKERNVEYYQNAAAAAAAGYRPCLRCRPEAAPGTPATRAKSALVAAALRLIDQGELDPGSVPALARRIGISARHLRRLFVAEIGAGPLEIGATKRLLFAKKLLNETTLPVTQVALAAGYGSLRRFNAAFRTGYGQAPRELRRGSVKRTGDALVLRLPYRAPYDFAALLGFFARRAIPGIEDIDARSYRRVFALDGVVGSVCVTQLPDERALALALQFPQIARVQEIAARVRRMFDLDADIGAINAQLARSAELRKWIRRHPGQRLPGGWDGFEIAVRAVLGQQISVAAARTLAARLVQRFGRRVVTERGDKVQLFPAADALAAADLGSIGLPRARALALRSLAGAVHEGRLSFRVEQTLDQFVAAATALPGIGPWTAHYIAMRALSQPDAFPAADLVLRKAVSPGGEPVPLKALEQIAEAWRPWRAYAVLHLWRSTS